MVDQLLDLTRARRAGGIPVQRRAETDLVQVALRATEELRSANPQAKVIIAAPEPVLGSWDSDRLMQAVSNLVGNALLHGRGLVDVRIHGTTTDAILEVHNGGPAVPDEIRDRLFQAFHGGAHTGAGRSGLGLGLFITERIVHAHGGRIDVSSTHVNGTTFTVRLPTGLDSPFAPAARQETPDAVLNGTGPSAHSAV
jgi:signal transduction histidine kinase